MPGKGRKRTVADKKLHRKWRYARKGLKKLEFRYATIGPGCELVSAFTDRNCWPAGQVWYRHVGKVVLETLHSYVPPWARRAGVRTALHRELLRAYPKTRFVITGEASGTAPRRWLRKMKFRRTPTGWKLRLR